MVRDLEGIPATRLRSGTSWSAKRHVEPGPNSPGTKLICETPRRTGTKPPGTRPSYKIRRGSPKPRGPSVSVSPDKIPDTAPLKNPSRPAVGPEHSPPVARTAPRRRRAPPHPPEVSPLTVAALLHGGGGQRAAGQAAERRGSAEVTGGHGVGGRDGADTGARFSPPRGGTQPRLPSWGPARAPEGPAQGPAVGLGSLLRPGPPLPPQCQSTGWPRSPSTPKGCCIPGYVGVTDKRANPTWNRDQTHPGSNPFVKIRVEWGPGPIWPRTKSVGPSCKTLRGFWSKPTWNLTRLPNSTGIIDQNPPEPDPVVNPLWNREQISLGPDLAAKPFMGPGMEPGGQTPGLKSLVELGMASPPRDQTHMQNPSWDQHQTCSGSNPAVKTLTELGPNPTAKPRVKWRGYSGAGDMQTQPDPTWKPASLLMVGA